MKTKLTEYILPITEGLKERHVISVKPSKKVFTAESMRGCCLGGAGAPQCAVFRHYFAQRELCFSKHDDSVFSEKVGSG